MWSMKQLVIILWTAFALISTATVATAQDGYRIQPGDVLSVEVLQDPSLNREILVLPDGSISFPFAGGIRASGLTTGQVQASIAQGISSNFAVQPNVFVTVRQVGEPVFGLSAAARTIDIYYLGEWNTPGVVEVPPGTTLIQALSLGGGFSNFAATNRVQLRRVNRHTGQTSVITLDYRAIARGATLSNDPVLADGDVILAPERRLFE
jgi:polysaccharide export outer membrane protein